ncbi:MAG: alanine racemase [Actinomycetota bacterium]
MAEPLTRAELTIDLGAVEANWSRLGAIANRAQVAAMVKADGYGLGAREVTTALAGAGCREFFVAEVGEGIALRAADPDIDIFILAGAQPGTLDELVEHRLTPVLIDLAQIDAWAAQGISTGVPQRASVHLDTGMNRTGLDPDQTRRLMHEPERLDGITVVHVMSHLASADDPQSDQSARQLEAYHQIRARLSMGLASMANTPGIGLGSAYHFDHVRPGIGLYGADPTPGRTLGLTPVVSLHAPVLQVRQVQAGETVGYSATHRAETNRRVATIGVGYGDGVLRSQSGRGAVAFSGHRAPIVGRISMDLITVDITDVPPDAPIEAGTAAELIGPTITIDDVADAAGTIPYEILTGLGRRYRRRHIR